MTFHLKKLVLLRKNQILVRLVDKTLRVLRHHHLDHHVHQDHLVQQEAEGNEH